MKEEALLSVSKVFLKQIQKQHSDFNNVLKPMPK